MVSSVLHFGPFLSVCSPICHLRVNGVRWLCCVSVVLKHAPRSHQLSKQCAAESWNNGQEGWMQQTNGWGWFWERRSTEVKVKRNVKALTDNAWWGDGSILTRGGWRWVRMGHLRLLTTGWCDALNNLSWCFVGRSWRGLNVKHHLWRQDLLYIVF